MANRLFGMFGNNQPINPMSNMLNAFQNFKMDFTGDPYQRVQNLVNTGQMSPSQLNQLMAMANQLRGIFPR